MTLEQEVRVAGAGAAAENSAAGARAGLRPLLWRLHFLGGFLAAPVVLSLAVTGILFAWNPQIEAALHRDALTAVAGAPDRPLAEQVRAAQGTHPGYEVTRVVPAAPAADGGEQTTAVTLSPPDPDIDRFGQDVGVTTVYVDPGSATVTGQILEANRPDEWIRNLHSNWRVGQESWLEPLSETAASWVLVSVLTGLYLWWPRNRRALARTFRFRRPGRLRARSVHTTLGVGITVALLLMVGTGLSWSTYAGGWIDLAKSQLRSGTPAVVTQLAGTDAAGASIDRVAATARAAGLTGVLALEPPDQPGQAWTASTEDSRWPIRATTIAVDHTGQVTDRVGWGDYPLLAKATTLGIAFHQAELFGLANRIGLTVIAVALIVLIIAGYRMWWLRRPAGGLGIPPTMGPLLRTVPVPLLLGFGALMVLLPTLGVSFLIYLAIERLVRAVGALAGATR